MGVRGASQTEQLTLKFGGKYTGIQSIPPVPAAVGFFLLPQLLHGVSFLGDTGGPFPREGNLCSANPMSGHVPTVVRTSRGCSVLVVTQTYEPGRRAGAIGINPYPLHVS